MAELKVDTGERAPWFCNGCPHNTSTRVPEGSRAVAASAATTWSTGCPTAAPAPSRRWVARA